MVIYLTKNLINKKKYIGKDSHNDLNYLGSGALLLEDIRKYGKKNFKKEILEYCTKENLGEREEYWIDFYKAVESDQFYNLRSQTSGWYNKDLNEEKYNYVINKMSKALLGKVKPEGFGKKISENQSRKDKLSKANKGKPKPEGFGELISKIKLSQNIKFTQKHKDNITKGKLGKKQPQSFLEKKYKSILQFDKEDNFIKEWPSIKSAIEFYKVTHSTISCCLRGISKTSCGFKWKYK